MNDTLDVASHPPVIPPFETVGAISGVLVLACHAIIRVASVRHHGWSSSPVEEAYDRLLERLGILTLVFLQVLDANERVDVHLIQQDANRP